MFARLAFSVCAHVDADVLVVDEALSVGDGAFQQKCMRHLHAARQRCALVFVSHDLAVVSKLCDRVLWLERGAVRAAGPAREVCRRYEAAISSESTEDNERFRIGGRAWRETEPVGPPAVRETAVPEVTVDFDPDAPLHEAGGAVIERIGLYSADKPVRVLSGNEDVELRIECRAERALVEPTVGFMVRDRLGQGLFGDHTHSGAAPALPVLEAGRGFSASFRFRFPNLLSGEYSVEAAIYEGPPEQNRMVARLRDSAFLSMQSRHPGGGLVNILLSGVDLAVGSEAPAPALGSGKEAVPATSAMGRP
jgi:lipopolysaccharide transport system ATP-binding protein